MNLGKKFTKSCKDKLNFSKFHKGNFFSKHIRLFFLLENKENKTK